MRPVAVVTGAAGGIGGAVVRALTLAGWQVAALDKNAAVLDKLVADTGHGVGLTCDVSDRAQVRVAFASAEAGLGPTGLLVNCAGILRPGAAHEVTDADWDAMFAVNTTGVLNACREAAALMVPRRSGVIITIGSNAARVPRLQLAAYAASKAAAVQYTRCLGLELAQYGIRCNVVSPGSTDTPMQRDLWDDADAGARAAVHGCPDAFRLGIPLGRIAAPGDVADAVVFLASDQARHITLQDLYVDGGASL
ncbi:2,3-dihydro-2,3-dihydroxybenzoate dehydrogenase [Streptomyces enissocaesilis]|uniref:2,3-dihydro-2,3-dihydroxybenzoate dehydrogenase n=1 Tax=Streptomyces enissocaesilis TaxID=332589 RepID=A0ABN3X8G8_9ACTN